MGGRPTSGSRGTLKSGPRWASAGWTLRNHPGDGHTMVVWFPTVDTPTKPWPQAFRNIKPMHVRLPSLLSSPADSLSDGCFSSGCGWRCVNLLQTKTRHRYCYTAPPSMAVSGESAHSQEGKPPPKNMLKRSSGVMSASKPLWKSKPPPCEWPGLLGSSPPVRSYCRRLFGLLSTA